MRSSNTSNQSKIGASESELIFGPTLLSMNKLGFVILSPKVRTTIAVLPNLFITGAYFQFENFPRPTSTSPAQNQVKTNKKKSSLKFSSVFGLKSGKDPPKYAPGHYNANGAMVNTFLQPNIQSPK